MTTSLAPAPVLRVYDNIGNLAALGSIYTYIAGTSTPVTTYTDSTGSTPNTNPIVLNSRGECQVWLNPTQSYKLVAYDANSVLLWTVDHIQGGSASFGGIITQASSGFFYQSAGAVVNRINDREFIGAATINDGNAWSATPGAGGNQDYVSVNIPQGPTTALSQFAALSTVGGIGGLFGSRSSDGGGSGTEDSLALTGISVNDYTTTPVVSEAGYFEAQKKSGAGTTTGVEIDVVNQGAVVSYDPYKSLFTASTGYTYGLAIASGGSRAGVSTASCGLNFRNNGATFNKGIVFSLSSLDSNNEALSMYAGCAEKWYTASTQAFGTAASATVGSNVLNFTATAYTPYIGMVVSPSDSTSTFAANTFVTAIMSSTQVILSTNALKTSSGLTMSALVTFPTNVIQSTSVSSNQDSLIFTDIGILLGSSPSTNGGLNSMGGLLIKPITNATTYVTITPGAGTSPIISTNAGSLMVSSTTGGVSVGNTIAAPTATFGTSQIDLFPTVATPSGGSASLGLLFGSGNVGIYVGSGVPTVAANQGSLYLRTDGSSTSTRLYVATNNVGGWTNVTTAT